MRRIYTTLIKTHNICIMGLILYYWVTAQRTMSLCIYKEIINLYFFTKPKFMMYCGIIIVRRGPMFVAFVDRHCEWIYIPTNIYAGICPIFIHEIELATNKSTSLQTRKILTTLEHWPHRIKNDSTVYDQEIVLKAFDGNAYKLMIHNKW